MHAMILAAGRGERLRPVTDTLPKALVRVNGRPLIEWQVERLAASGFTELVINHAWLGEQIVDHLGTGERFGARIHYSAEKEALETLGGIVSALPALGTGAFLVVSADIYTEYPYALLAPIARDIDHPDAKHDAYLVLVDNPVWHPGGDMALDAQGAIRRDGTQLTYANIGLFHPRLFRGLARGVKQKLFPWAYQHVERGRVRGGHYRGTWHNIGTQADLDTATRECARRAGSHSEA